jgi:ATP-dependent Clp protease ATP-binding subunit ClpA
VIRILSRRTKNNPLLIGEPGTGKTAIVEGLAQRIVNRDVPVNLIGELWSLDLGALTAGASYKGQFEERVKSVVEECEKSDNVILFIDEMVSTLSNHPLTESRLTLFVIFSTSSSLVKAQVALEWMQQTY